MDASFAGRESECRPEFPDQAGWFGGDAAYSIPLPTEDGRTSLWLFGDSFVARPGSVSRRQYPFVHNSIALSDCSKDGDWTLDYYWGDSNTDTPHAFFTPDPNSDWVRRHQERTDEDAYYWLFDGFVSHGALFVGLLRVAPSEPRGPFQLPFRLLGMDLARIENYRNSPEKWQIEISSLSDDELAFPGSAFVTTEDYVYAFTFFDRGNGRAPRALSRLDRRRLASWRPDLSKHLQTLDTNGTWSGGFDPGSAKILMHDDASEMSVHFDTASKTWLAVYNHPMPTDEEQLRDIPATRIWLRRAARLEGPWSSPEILYEIPETRPDSNVEPDPNLFCYAAKAHPQFSAARELLVTYVCNLYSRSEGETLEILRRLRGDSDLYRPRAVSIEIPPAPPLGPFDLSLPQ